MSARFNEGQRTAVGSRAGRVVISAGAGSGKTRVLVQRFVDRVFEQEAAGVSSPMRSVLLITFTDKAAGELIERVRGTFLESGRPDLAREVDGAWISTIHGFCARIVRRHALELGVDPGFAVLADPETGLERAAAFERAATRTLASPEHGAIVAQLVEDGVADLRATVLAGYDRARSKGMSAQDIGTPHRAGFERELSALAERLDTLLPRYRQLKETATMAKNLDGYVRLRAELTRVQGIRSPREGAEATFALSAYRGALRGDEETRSLTLQINEAIRSAAQAAIDTLAAERATAWRQLLLAFADEYGRAKERMSALDFEDLQLLARRLWSERPDIAERLGGRFVEIMVDEFQDTNPLQLQVIEPISRHAQCVVGDAQQSIYRFRDADVTLLEAKRRDAERGDAEQACRLTVNYRSDARLLDGLNAIFGTPDFFGGDYLTLESGAAAAEGPWPADAPRIEAIIVDKGLCGDEEWRAVEARALAQRLLASVARGHARPGEIVVLCRASATMHFYVDALRQVGFDVVASASGGFYATPEYFGVRALLRVLANALDDEGVLGLLAGGFGGVSDDALLMLARRGRGRSLWQAVAEAGAAGLSGKDASRAELILTTVERLRGMRGRLPLADAILHAGCVLGPGGGLLERPDAWANVRKIVRLASAFESAGTSDPAAFLGYLDDRQAFIPREPAGGLAVEGSGSVRVMTVHAAKGLEFPVVAVADLGHEPMNRFPSFLLSLEGDGLVVAARGPRDIGGEKADASTAWATATDEEKRLDLEEAKRVFYVACTRAERALFLVGSTMTDRAPRDGIAADWVLQAATVGGEDRTGLLDLSVIGPEDIPDLPPLAREEWDADSSTFEPSPEPRLREPEAIPAPEEVSYTALALYERCAYRFFAERMLRVGSLTLPKSEDPLAFGSALHAALELIARGDVVDAERLRRISDSRILPEGSVARLEAAVEAVRASGAGTLLSEGRPEVAFAIRVSGGVVRGTMDLVVRDHERATVLDYKTGRDWDATGERYAAQAEVYALALLESGLSAVRVRFLHVEGGLEEVTFDFTKDDRPRVLARIEDAFERMRSSGFPPLKAFEPTLCADCPVSGSLCRITHPHAHGRTR